MHIVELQLQRDSQWKVLVQGQRHGLFGAKTGQMEGTSLSLRIIDPNPLNEASHRPKEGVHRETAFITQGNSNPPWGSCQLLSLPHHVDSSP